MAPDATDDVVWEEPPEIPAYQQRWGRVRGFVAVLEANPGKWARYGKDFNRSYLSYLRRAYPHVEWQQQQEDKRGLYTVWARYNDKEGSDAATD